MFSFSIHVSLLVKRDMQGVCYNFLAFFLLNEHLSKFYRSEIGYRIRLLKDK